MTFFWNQLRAGTSVFCFSTAFVASTLHSMTSHPAWARMAPPYVVMNDRGGNVAKRAWEIQEIAARNKRVEIRGSICLSSCTMFLGSPDVCVNPRTRLGFHGPTNHGAQLTPEQFDYWSRVIAAHYPENIARWFMTKARYLTEGYYYLTGEQLIEMGFPNCEDRIGP